MSNGTTYTLEDVFSDMMPVSKAPTLSELEERAGGIDAVFRTVISLERGKNYKALKDGAVFFVRNPALSSFESREWIDSGRFGPCPIRRELPRRKGLLKDLAGGGRRGGEKVKSLDELTFEQL